MAYFERQIKRQCTLHALNNALGRKVATVRSMNDAAKEIAAECARGAMERFAKKGGTGKFFDPIFKKYLENLSGDGGNWPIDVARRWLRQRGIRTEHVRLQDIDFLEGRFVISTVASGIPHAIALVDGVLYDSLKTAPVILKEDALPPEYVSGVAFRIMIDF